MAWGMAFQYDAQHVNLDGLRVGAAAGRAFGKERREVLARFAARSHRYGGDDMTRLFISTTGTLDGAAVNHSATRQEALQALLPKPSAPPSTEG